MSALTEFAMKEAWGYIAPVWPLQNFIANNPLQGFEDLPFEEALNKASHYFEMPILDPAMESVNRNTIKWCQCFFDQGQSVLKMPERHLGLYKAWKKLFIFDKRAHNNHPEMIAWLKNLPDDPEQCMDMCLKKMNTKTTHYSKLFTFLLTSLPGWAGYVKYSVEWKKDNHCAQLDEQHPICLIDYLAMRVVLTVLFFPNIMTFILAKPKKVNQTKEIMDTIKHQEAEYSSHLLELFKHEILSLKDTEINNKNIDAQCIFCIDVRSEPFRLALESQKNYETFGFAGFFGIFSQIKEYHESHKINSCPVLLSAEYSIEERPLHTHEQTKDQKEKKRLRLFKSFYQSLKYNFTTPFGLVELLGPCFGLWMGIKTLFPGLAKKSHFFVKNKLNQAIEMTLSLQSMPEEAQLAAAKNMLTMIGLTENFSPFVILCGHASQTTNNAYASALDCGACGGNAGRYNAQIMATILNKQNIRQALKELHIIIPENTLFIAAEHNTTTDDVNFLPPEDKLLFKTIDANLFSNIQEDFKKAKIQNNHWRYQQMETKQKSPSDVVITKNIEKRSHNWAETRPEWGLAKNAAFLVGPRFLTQGLKLNGRCFLHSYDWKKDPEGNFLEVIMTAPMIVTQWINSQYLFSTLNNIAYGSGSKVTQNITGKIGIMQGNASDLMHGLPLQSVYKNDNEAYHQILRLMTVIYAPRHYIDRIIEKHAMLQKLFSGQWIFLAAIEPEERETYLWKGLNQWEQFSE